MPVKCRKGKPKYRVKTTNKGTKLRLAFCGNSVVEAKRLGEKTIKSMRRK